MKKLAAAVAIICGIFITISIGWYYLYSLPRASSQKIELEREKFELEKKEKEEKDAKERVNRGLFNLCIEGADEKYWDWMRLNGTEKADGTIWASDYHWDMAAKRKKAALDECYKQYK